MIKIKNISIQGKHNRPIGSDVFFQNDQKPKSIIILCHGYKGFKDWGAWDLVAEAFAKAGFFFIKFNFSHNGGTIKQPIDFPDLDAFGNNNFIKELDDLDSVLNWVESDNFEHKTNINKEAIALIGHSRGGGIAIIKAAEDRRIKKLITWASISNLESRFPTGNELQNWKDQGVLFVENGRTKQQMPHYFQFYTSFKENKERLTISNVIKKLAIPHLIIHGTDDPTVSVNEAHKISKWSHKSELFLIAGADHVFGAKHPWNASKLPADLKTLVKKSISFSIF